jgi:hypothetical protein
MPHRAWIAWIVSVALIVSPLAAWSAPANQASTAVAAEVRGTLLLADGKPAIGYQVGLRGKSGDLFISPATGADGSFAITSIPPDTYQLVAFAPDGAEFPVLGKEVALTAGQIERTELRIGGKASPPGSGLSAEQATPATNSKGGGKSWFRHTGVQVAVAVVGAFALASLFNDDDDKNEPRSVSPSTPGR